ncbi:MAG: helix-turn-helix domain-containing protein [Rhodospirillaceae bacterium]|nr:MAG: helix-turn-helix domain-containing protein [Rhodospirillaceae bacterium]
MILPPKRVKITHRWVLKNLFVAMECHFAFSLGMVTPREIRAARAFMGWTREELAQFSLLSLNSIVRLEKEEGSPRLSTVQRVREVFEKCGIRFLSLSGQTEGISYSQQYVRGKPQLRHRLLKST